MTSPLSALRSLLYPGDAANIELALLLAEGQGLSLAPIQEELEALLAVAELFPKEPWQNYQGGQWQPLLRLLRRILALSIEEQNWPDLPESIAFFGGIRILELHNNRIARLGDGIWAHLPQLHTLSLKTNELRDLPQSLAALPKLKCLLLHDNPLETWPSVLDELQDIEVLDLSQTPLRVFPERLWQRPKLQRLILDKGHEEELPQAAWDWQARGGKLEFPV